MAAQLTRARPTYLCYISMGSPARLSHTIAAVVCCLRAFIIQ
jgi:hypothetical protein